MWYLTRATKEGGREEGRVDGFILAHSLRGHCCVREGEMASHVVSAVRKQESGEFCTQQASSLSLPFPSLNQEEEMVPLTFSMGLFFLSEASLETPSQT